MERASRLFDLSALVAHEVNDSHRELESLIDLVRICTQYGILEDFSKLEERLNAARKGFESQKELFTAISEIVQGSFSLTQGAYETALSKYRKAYADLAELPGYASYLLTDYIRDMEWHLRSLPSEIALRWCKELETEWLKRSISVKRSDMLDLIGRVRFDLLKKGNI